MNTDIRVQSAVAPVAAMKAADTGKNPPASGNTLPDPAAKQPSASDVARAAGAIQKYLSQSGSQLQFQVDDSSGRMIIRLVDPTTGDVVRQIPTADVVKLAAILGDKGLHFLSDNA